MKATKLQMGWFFKQPRMYECVRGSMGEHGARYYEASWVSCVGKHAMPCHAMDHAMPCHTMPCQAKPKGREENEREGKEK